MAEDNGVVTPGDNQLEPKNLDKFLALQKELFIGLGVDQRNEALLFIETKKGLRQYPIWSRGAKDILARLIYQKTNKIPGDEHLKIILRMFAAIAEESEQHSLEPRLAEHADAIHVNLDGEKAVRINREGWVIQKPPRPLFRYHPNQKSLYTPERVGADVRLVNKFVNLSNDKMRLMFLCHLIACLIPGIPISIVVVTGTHGATKTTFTRVWKRLIDPTIVEVRGSVYNVGELALIAFQNRMLVFDNLTFVPDWLSDALCRIVTGDGYEKKALYTNEDTISFVMRRIIALTGINLVAERADLLDRSVIYHLDPIPDEQRKSEKQFWAEFNEVAPRILGGIFDTLVKAMQIEPTLQIARLPRMADFARWGCAIAIALGHTAEDFLDAYAENVQRQNEAALDASLVAQVVIQMMKTWEPEWSGTPSELLLRLDEYSYKVGVDRHTKGWPKTPNWLMRKLREVVPNLERVGFRVVERRTAKDRIVSIRTHNPKA